MAGCIHGAPCALAGVGLVWVLPVGLLPLPKVRSGEQIST